MSFFLFFFLLSLFVTLYIFLHLTVMHSSTLGKGWVGMSACPLVVLACESLHVCTVCIWRCEHARFCVEVFYALYINFHSFIHVFGSYFTSSFHLLLPGFLRFFQRCHSIFILVVCTQHKGNTGVKRKTIFYTVCCKRKAHKSNIDKSANNTKETPEEKLFIHIIQIQQHKEKQEKLFIHSICKNTKERQENKLLHRQATQRKTGQKQKQFYEYLQATQ